MRKQRIDGNDLLGLVGLIMLGVGLWLWWPPAALMVCGGILVAVSVLGAIARANKRGP